MKKYFLIFTIIIFIISFISISFITIYSINFVKQKTTQNLNKQRKKEYNLLIKNKKEYLLSIAKYLANSPLVKKAYKEDKPKIIYNEFKVLFDSMNKKGLIKELHFFEYPAINFIDFPHNINIFDASKKRLDILNVETAKKPDVFYYTCAKYPGLRAVYPIKINSEIVGIVSFGMDIENLINKFKDLGAKKVSLLLNNNLLKYSLLPKFYEKYKKFPLIDNYIILGDKIEKDKLVITKIELKDLFDNKIGELIIADDNSYIVNVFLKQLFIYIGISIFILIIILLFNFKMLNYIINELKKTDKYIYYIKNQEFEKLPSNIEIKNEINKHQQSIIDSGKEIAILINILQSKKNKYYQKAYTDSLTGAFSRRFLQDKEHELFLKYQTLKKEIAILMFDIDDFKKINDTYGHDVGDIVLSEIGESVKKILREDDIFIRYGGEEFIVILENIKLKHSITIAEKIRKTIENNKINIGNNKEINVTISIGISELKNDDKSLFDAIKRVDKKLYKAKNNGKNRWEI
jgi:diguanylate cyclase (GGDEF)-like protein